jgi:hypothetical protein
MISGHPDWSALSSQNERLADATDGLAGRHSGDRDTPGQTGGTPVAAARTPDEAVGLPLARPAVPGGILHLGRRRGSDRRYHGTRGSTA